MNKFILYIAIYFMCFQSNIYASHFINENKINYSEDKFLENEDYQEKYIIIEKDIIENINKNYSIPLSAPFNYSWIKWNNGVIYYTFKPFTLRNKIHKKRKILPHEREFIRMAMDELENIANIKFIEVSKKPPQNYLEFIVGNGCFSGIGAARPQTVSIGEGCAQKGVILHELMHSLGFLHEQSRADRDDYVEIIDENIIPGKESNFRISNTSTLEFGPYDFYSIMHYALNEFSINPAKLTIKPLYTNIEWKYIGRSTYLSDLDIDAIQQAYGISEYFKKR